MSGASPSMRVIGLMSGTSLDGLDVLLLDLRGERPETLEWEVVAARTFGYAPERRDEIRTAIEEGGARELCLLHVRLAEWWAEAVGEMLRGAGTEAREVRVLGSHGQTVWHEPPREGRRGASFQLGCPATLAERTGIDVVHDFRARDLAAGGHGAPLVPWADRLLFSVPGRSRALQNLGGMGNVTRLAPAGPESGGGAGGIEGAGDSIIAFDTGPGVALLDAATELATGGRAHFDEEGRRAARGSVDEELLERLLDDPFFRTPPPRTTGRETFGTPLVRRIAAERGLEPGSEEAGWDDLLATFVGVTARSIAAAYRAWVIPHGLDEVVLTGGGARNPVLVEAIRRELDGLPVETGDALPLDPDFREAAAFALMAWAHVRGVPANVPAATGADGPRVLGSWTPGGAGAGGSGGARAAGGAGAAEGAPAREGR